MNRKTDPGNVRPIRGGRYFKLHDFWFFATREGATIGPYDTREQAVMGTMEFIRYIQNAPAAALKLLVREPVRLSA